MEAVGAIGKIQLNACSCTFETPVGGEAQWLRVRGYSARQVVMVEINGCARTVGAG